MGHLRLRLSAKMPHGQLVSQLLLGFRREMFDLNKAARPKPYRRRLLTLSSNLFEVGRMPIAV